MTNTSYLSAILFCDIEGYTALMQKDEENTLFLLDHYLQTLTKIVSKYGGEIIKNYGDGSICLFTSAVRSLECAIELQQILRRPPEVPLRIGLNLGDVHRKDDDVFGDAINVTSRIESMGRAGNILMSHSMYQKVKNHPEFKFQSVGKFDFKNVNETLEIYAIANAGFIIPKRKELIGKFKKKQSKLSKFLPAVILVAMIIYFFVTRFWQQDDSSETQIQNKIAVLEFDDHIIGDTIYNMAGKMASDWIIHGITQNKLGQVISPEIIEDYSDVLEGSNILSTKNKVLTDYLKPSKIIKGAYYLNKNRLLFHCSITDEIMNRTLISFEPVECDPKAPLDCIEALKQRILGFLVTEDKKIAALEDSPPSFEAYEFFNQAKSIYLKDPQDPEILQLVEKAIDADNSYFEPKVYKFQYYYNSGDLIVADSLLKPLLESYRTSERQKILLRIYEALLELKYKEAHKFQQIEYNITPFDLQTNSNMMIHSLQLVNKPGEIDSVFNEINMAEMDISKRNFCVERYKIKGMADIERKRYESAISLLKFALETGDYSVLKKVLLRAYIRAGKYAIANDVLSNLQLPVGEAGEREWVDIHLSASKDFIWADKKDMANIHLDKIINSVDNILKSIPEELVHFFAESLFYRGDYEEAVMLLENLLESYPGLIDYHALLAIAYQKIGQTSKATAKLLELENLRADFQLGEVDYGLAQFYASNSDDNNTMKYLRQAINDGHWYETWTFQNDPLLKSYFETEDFKLILTQRH
ncbi:MAG: adenylate/guanylate cyclase domain-containing protein [Flavobacteriaceae bacterium]